LAFPVPRRFSEKGEHDRGFTPLEPGSRQTFKDWVWYCGMVVKIFAAHDADLPETRRAKIMCLSQQSRALIALACSRSVWLIAQVNNGPIRSNSVSAGVLADRSSKFSEVGTFPSSG